MVGLAVSGRVIVNLHSRKVFNRCLEGIRIVSGFWKVSGMCLEGIRRVPGKCLEDVWRVDEGV